MVNYTPKLKKDRHLAPDSNNLESINAKDLMVENFPKFQPEMLMENAIQQFVKHHTPGGPVMENNGSVVGYLSQRDCLRLARENRYNRSESSTVKQYMKNEVKTVDSNTNLQELVDLFSKEWYHNYPVTEGGKVIGLIDRHSVLEAFERTKATTW